MQTHRKFLFATLIASLVLTVGCGSKGPKLSKVYGVVTLDGKPVPNAAITFVPTDATPRSPSYGKTDSEGRYTLAFSRDRYGAIPAVHIVQIETDKPSKSELKELKEIEAAGGPPVPEYVPIPKKYLQEGALTATVTKGTNEINFELTSN